jgi:hypothetical protein
LPSLTTKNEASSRRRQMAIGLNTAQWRSATSGLPPRQNSQSQKADIFSLGRMPLKDGAYLVLGRLEGNSGPRVEELLADQTHDRGTLVGAPRSLMGGVRMRLAIAPLARFASHSPVQFVRVECTQSPKKSRWSERGAFVGRRKVKSFVPSCDPVAAFQTRYLDANVRPRERSATPLRTLGRAPSFLQFCELTRWSFAEAHSALSSGVNRGEGSV